MTSVKWIRRGSCQIHCLEWIIDNEARLSNVRKSKPDDRICWKRTDERLQVFCPDNKECEVAPRIFSNTSFTLSPSQFLMSSKSVMRKMLQRFTVSMRKLFWKKKSFQTLPSGSSLLLSSQWWHFLFSFQDRLLLVWIQRRQRRVMGWLHR